MTLSERMAARSRQAPQPSGPGATPGTGPMGGTSPAAPGARSTFAT